MKALVAHPGTQHSFRLASELQRLGALSEFHTGLALPGGGIAGWCWNLLPPVLRRRIANRRLDGVPFSKLRLHPLIELTSQIGSRKSLNVERAIHQRNERFQHGIPQHAIESAGAVIGFDTSSWILAERCERAGVPLLLDQSIAHPDSKVEILTKVRAEYPDWQEGIEPRIPEVRLAEQLEHEKAAMVVAASSFTIRTLVENGVARERIQLNPYGVDAGRFAMKQGTGGHNPRFVFVGSITARKGVPLLLRAWAEMQPENAELWLVGPVAPRLRQLIPDSRGIRVLGAVPHSEIPAVLRQCDVFVFPSYFEGFGLVILEAMACGLPVITTAATAGPDIFRSGEAGWISPAGDLEGLVTTMEDCLAHPGRLSEMGRMARHIAEQQSWSAYGERWLSILDKVGA